VRDQVHYTIRVISGLEELEALSEPWTDLLKETTSADNIFMTWEWQYTWAKHYLGKNKLFTLLVYKSNDQLVGIAPFYIRRTGPLGALTLREIRFLGSEGVGSAYLDFIVPEKHKQMALSEIYRHLHQEGAGSWDILTLSDVPAESSSIDLWQGLVQQAGQVSEVVDMAVCPVIELPDRLEDFLGRISRNERYNLQRKGKRLELAGRVTFEWASSSREVEKALDSLIELHTLRWKDHDSGGAFRCQRFLMFHREIVHVFGQRRWIRLDFLLGNEDRIAGIYGFCYNGRYSYYLPALDPAIIPQASPGILLLFHCVGEAIREGCSQVDLLKGWADYKIAWANRLRRCLTLRHYNTTVRAAGMKLLAGAKDTVKVIVR